MERLKQRGIIRNDQAEKIQSRNTTPADTGNPQVGNTAPPVTTEQEKKIAANRAKAMERLQQRQQNFRDASENENNSLAIQPDKTLSKKRPLDGIRPSIRKQDYIEYDFSTMKNSLGGFINRQDDDYDLDNPIDKKQKSFDDWKREQREKLALYEDAPPPADISLAPKCTECNINMELDPTMREVFHLQVCKTCVKNHPEKYSLLTKTECKEDYFLTDPELNDTALFYRLEKPNPHSGTFARMQLFVRCQVEAFAFKKWGGDEGLDSEWQRREEGKAMRREKKYQQKLKEMRMKTRAQEYTNRLREKKHGTEHIHDFSAPVDGGTDEDGLQILKRRCIGCGMETEEIAL